MLTAVCVCELLECFLVQSITNAPVSKHIRFRTASTRLMSEVWSQPRSAAAAYWTSWSRTSDHAHLDHAPSTSPWRHWRCEVSKQETRTGSRPAERAPCPTTPGTTHSSYQRMRIGGRIQTSLSRLPLTACLTAAAVSWCFSSPGNFFRSTNIHQARHSVFKSGVPS